MPIEGPLHELGMHDVFQLLDLSRKTGVLTVTSARRDSQGHVYFDRGGVTFAAMRNNERPLGELLLRAGKITRTDLDRAIAAQEREMRARALGEVLVDLGAISRRELERHVRFQVEEIVFELLSWRDGYFSFEERDVEDAPAEASVRISTESLLMEGARRIDEWSRIAALVPHAGIVPALAPAHEDQPALLDLLPNEWEVLAEIDGQRDIRAIAAQLARSEFEIAKITYGLVTTGVVEVRDPATAGESSEEPESLVRAHLDRGVAALRAGEAEAAVAAARQALAADPRCAEAHLLAARALGRLGQHAQVDDELRRAAQLGDAPPELFLELGFAALRRGGYDEVIEAWQRYLHAVPDDPNAARMRVAAVAAARLRDLLAEHDRV